MPNEKSKNKSTAMEIAKSKRAKANREMNREALRMKMKGSAYISQLDRAAREYLDILNSMQGLKDKRLTVKSARRLIQIDSQLSVIDRQLKVLQGLVDLNIRRLKFVLPELKAVELKGDDGDIDPLTKLANTIAGVTKEITGELDDETTRH